LSDLAQIKPPINIKILNPFWSAKKSARKGGISTWKKYGQIGDPVKRYQRWQVWWQEIGKFNPNRHFVRKDIHKPDFSKELAEF